MKFKPSESRISFHHFSVVFSFCFMSTFLQYNRHLFEELIQFLNVGKKQLGLYVLGDLALIRAVSAAERYWCSRIAENPPLMLWANRKK